jgi:hypothetical protein
MRAFESARRPTAPDGNKASPNPRQQGGPDRGTRQHVLAGEGLVNASLDDRIMVIFAEHGLLLSVNGDRLVVRDLRLRPGAGSRLHTEPGTRHLDGTGNEPPQRR